MLEKNQFKSENIKNYKFSDITFNDLKKHIKLVESDVNTYAWEPIDIIVLSDKEKYSIDSIISHIAEMPVHLLNEATIWARAIYPLLMLAETKNIRAWAQIPLSSHYKHFSLEGVVDGVLAKSYVGRVEAPYLVVVEAKRGTEAQNPVIQTYAQMLAAAYLNWQQTPQLPQIMFGCYTIADSWTFLRAEVSNIDTDLPTMQIENSREYVEKLEAETIMLILKQIVSYQHG